MATTTNFEEFFSTLDPEAIHRITTQPLAWAEAFLTTPVLNTPFKANHIQDLILNSKHRYNIIRVHRRGGKTFSMTILALFYALMFEKVQVLIICPGSAQVQEIFNTIRDFINANAWIQPYVTTDRQAMPQILGFSTGSRIKGFTTAAKGKGKAVSLRGQGADIILIDEGAYLNEDDWPAIKPIMLGDEHRRWPPKVYIASTPAYTRGVYYELCTNETQKAEMALNWIHVSILANPSISPEFIAECRALCTNELDWIREYLAEFPEIAEGVFPKTLVDAARREFDYAANLRAATAENRQVKPPSRTIGVDWDKANKDGHGPNISVVEALADGRFRCIYREEIPQSQFTLTKGRDRVIALNDVFRPEWIYVDRGMGEAQIEELQIWGKRFPHSGLEQKVVGIYFASTVDCPMPAGKVEKRRFKQVMVSLLRTWFERGQLEINQADHSFYKDLLAYHVVKQSDSTIKFSSENDHSIDAVGLAAMAMHQKVKNPYAPQRAIRSAKVPLPEVVPSHQLQPQRGQSTSMGRQWARLFPGSSSGYSRTRLGRSAPIERTKF